MAEQDRRKPMGFYVDLDSLLDSRLGTLMLLDEKKALAMIANDNNGKTPKGHLYYGRFEDSFSFAGFNDDDFKELYSKRTKKTLMVSTITNIILNIEYALKEFLDKLIDHPLHKGYEVFVNIYPYLDLNNYELKQIKQCVNSHLGGLAKVHLLKKPLEEVTPKWLIDHVQYFYIYHYPDWLNTAGLDLPNVSANHITLVGPQIFFGGIPSEDDLQEFKKLSGHSDPNYFLMTHELYRSLINFNFIPADHFSIANNYYQELEQLTEKIKKEREQNNNQ